MILKPDEAEEKWCPFANGDDSHGCLINKCMAWKWYRAPNMPPAIGDVRDAEYGFCGATK